MTCSGLSCKKEVGQGVNCGVLIPRARLFGLQQSAAVAETAVRKEKEEREDEEGKRETHKG